MFWILLPVGENPRKTMQPECLEDLDGLGNSERWITGWLVGVSFRHDFTAPENGMKPSVDQYSGGLKKSPTRSCK